MTCSVRISAFDSRNCYAIYRGNFDEVLDAMNRKEKVEKGSYFKGFFHGFINIGNNMDNDIHKRWPNPQKLFGPFIYEGEPQVSIKSKIKL